jgi:hypothetical protein
MWENQGRPHGYDVLHWRQAEQEVTSCLESGSEARSAAPKKQNVTMERAGVR